MTGPLGTHLMLWGGNVHTLPLEARFEVARSGGFSAMSVSPFQV